jgi:tetratricopeptide (TPR) repeat protein
VKEWRYPFGRPPEAVFIILDGDSDTRKRKSLFEWLEAVLPGLNWRSHLFLVDGGHRAGGEAAREMVRIAGDFAEQHGFTTLHAHLLIELRPLDTRQRAAWEELIAPARPFQISAYELLTETRLHINPIIAPVPEVSVDEALAAAEFFNSRLATPSFHLAGGVLEELIDRASGEEIRFFVDPDRRGLTVQLWMSHVLETVVDGLEEDEDLLPSTCRRHLVVDEKSGGVFSCFKQWEANDPALFFDRDGPDGPVMPEAPAEVHCPDCIGRSALSMRENLRANDREREGHQVYSKLALAMAGKERHALAAELAHHAYLSSDSDRDRTAALIHEGLCLCHAGEFEKADEALKLANEYADDEGLVAYHRGRVQFEWREYIEALDRFEEALASGSNQVPMEDMCFEMALCHINIEEYEEARSYLERSAMPGQKKSVVSFYLGICDLAGREVQTAMDRFEEALRLDPAEEDLGRILFYIGTCLKEMGRFEEAIGVLERAVGADSEDVLNHNLLGFCYYKIKRHEEAVACFRRAVEIDPRSAIDWASLGSNLRDLGRIDEAIEMYEKALSLDPTIGFVRANLKLLNERRSRE